MRSQHTVLDIDRVVMQATQCDLFVQRAHHKHGVMQFCVEKKVDGYKWNTCYSQTQLTAISLNRFGSLEEAKVSSARISLRDVARTKTGVEVFIVQCFISEDREEAARVVR